jgi:hypothetical protein
MNTSSTPDTLTPSTDFARWEDKAREVFRVIDAKDIEGFLRFVSPDATFRFGNAPPLKGHAAIREGLKPFYASIAALHHTILGTWVSRSAIFCQMEVRYTRLDGGQVTLPVLNVMFTEGELFKDYLIYMDIAPVYAAAGAAA